MDNYPLKIPKYDCIKDKGKCKLRLTGDLSFECDFKPEKCHFIVREMDKNLWGRCK